MVRLFDASGEWPMLFNSYSFIFLFLPVVLLGYFALGRRSNLAPVVWLTLASLVFYALGGWQFVPLLLVSIAFNYGVGYLLIARKLPPRRTVCRAHNRRRRRSRRPRHLQICGIFRRHRAQRFDRGRLQLRRDGP